MNAARRSGFTLVEMLVVIAIIVILAGLILAFARGMGEFGITLMLAGSIPGRTQTLPLAIYDAVQANDLAQANALALTTIAIVSVLLFVLSRLPRVRL